MMRINQSTATPTILVQEVKKSGPPASLKLECIEGPHSGETLELTGTIVIGTRQASVRDKIQMGNSVFRILKI